ncbi:REPAT31 protein [Danaus plexippus plexippus]|uniref:REPAT31 protein n=2 Tax=Danaus plexippus TaxID=13037 RepID=A0A212F6X9_DANPL|nr:REPAT31 protein [Danaus plexippus plexippus]
MIKGIIARDLDHTKASATITAGGVGSTFANIRLKSERGSGLNYQIEIYV